jgi:hypothetical protein
MSVSYRRRKKLLARSRWVEGEGSLRRQMRRDPITYPRWIGGVKVAGELLNKVFPAIGTYTGEGHGKKIVIRVCNAFPVISTIAYFRQTMKAQSR